MVGLATNDTLQLNPSEWLDGAQLDTWLDQMQATSRVINVVMDFAGCGAFITNLVPPSDRERIVIASTMAGYERLNEKQGQVSFSRYFLSEVFNGKTIGQSFTKAQKAIRRVSGPLRQRALINDNGNAIPNERKRPGQPVPDGSVAISRYIGAAFLTGADAPVIGSVVPPTLLAGTNQTVIWAADIIDASGISNVWCIVTEPGYDGTNGLYQTDLMWNAASNRYEAAIFNVTNPGTYGLAFYASNSLGQVSPVVQSEVLSGDRFEPDDSYTNASLYLGPAQLHTFHTSNDEDWVRFYASSSYAYAVETVDLGDNVDTVLELYRELPDGSITNLSTPGRVDDSGPGEGEVADLDLGNPSGFYYVRVSQVTSNGWAPGSYELNIYIPAGGGRIIVYGFNGLTQGALPAGTVATINSSQESLSLPFNGSTSVESTRLSPKVTHQVAVTGVPYGYLPNESPTQPNQTQNPNNTEYGNPQNRGVEVDPTSFVFVQFVFTPHVMVNGLVNDKWTGEVIANATVSFRARNGNIANYVYDRCPYGATYQLPWTTQPDGNFPGGVWLPTVDWDVLLSKPGFSNTTVLAAIVNPVVGATTNVGLLRMAPIDSNGNGIADSWETIYFAGVSNVNPLADADSDGQNNRNEYLAGTNPTNAASVFKASQFTAINGFTLRWPVAAGRSYRIRSADQLATGVWSIVGGPWTAASGQSQMSYTDTNAPTSALKTYRIDALVP